MSALFIVTSSGPADGPDDAPAVRLISAITVGDRYRKDMGDLDALAASIREHGLLHPVVITVDGTLVAGERRLRACALLGWKHVPVTVVDVPDLLRAERDENEVRKAFAPAEAVAIGRVIEQQAEAANKERRRAIAAKAGRASAEKHYGPKPMESDMTKIFGHVEPLPGTTLSAVARAVGMSEVTYSRAKAVVKAAEADPAAFGDLAEQMDRTGQVHGAYNTLRERKAGTPSPRHPALRKLRHRQPGPEIERAISSIEAIGLSLSQINFRTIDSQQRAQLAADLKAALAPIARLAREMSNE